MLFLFLSDSKRGVFMRTINEHIKTNHFAPVYLIYGEESYLCQQAKEKLKKALVSPGDTMNFSRFEGKKIDLSEVIELAQTLPFFQDHRFLLLEDTGLFRSAPDELIDCIEQLPDTTCLCFLETEVDKRSKLYKTVKKCGYVANMEIPDDKTLSLWIVSLLKQENKQIKEPVLRFFLERTGTDMEHIRQELDKLCAYTLDRTEIVREDVEQITTQITTSKIFDMLEAVVQKKQQVALDYYYDLLALKESPLRILALLVRQFNLILQVKELDRRSVPKSEIAKKVGLPAFVVGKYIEQGKQFSYEQLKELLQKCIHSEEDVKTGHISDQIAVELLLIEFSTR